MTITSATSSIQPPTRLEMAPVEAAEYDRGGLYLCLSSRQCTLNGETLALTPTEFNILRPYACENRDGVLWLNPESCGRRRFDQEITFAVVTIDSGHF